MPASLVQRLTAYHTHACRCLYTTSTVLTMHSAHASRECCLLVDCLVHRALTRPMRDAWRPFRGFLRWSAMLVSTGVVLRSTPENCAQFMSRQHHATELRMHMLPCALRTPSPVLELTDCTYSATSRRVSTGPRTTRWNEMDFAQRISSDRRESVRQCGPGHVAVQPLASSALCACAVATSIQPRGLRLGGERRSSSRRAHATRNVSSFQTSC